MQYGEPTQNASAFSFVPGTYEATGLPWKAKTSMKMRGKAVPRFGLAAAFVSPMPSDLSVGRFAAGRGSVRRFGSRQETLVDISYRSAGWGAVI